MREAEIYPVKTENAPVRSGGHPHRRAGGPVPAGGGGGLFSAYIPSGAAVPGAEAPSPESSTDTCDPTDNAPLLEAGDAVLEALKRGDIQVLASLIDTERGVTFTPYSTVNPRSDLTFLPDQFTEAGINGTRYVWGATQGKGDPIELTLPEYLKRYVYNAEYTRAPVIGVDHVFSSGNSLENVAEAYPDARFLEYYFPGVDPSNNGFDWCALKLVFLPRDEGYRLVGIIHSEWTI